MVNDVFTEECIDAFIEADEDNDGIITADEYVTFTKLLIPTGYIGDDVMTLRELPHIFQNNFIYLACQCLVTGGDDNCCFGSNANIQIETTSDGDSDTDTISMDCHYTKHVITEFLLSTPTPPTSPPIPSPSSSSPSSEPSISSTDSLIMPLSPSSVPSVAPSSNPSMSNDASIVSVVYFVAIDNNGVSSNNYSNDLVEAMDVVVPRILSHEEEDNNRLLLGENQESGRRRRNSVEWKRRRKRRRRRRQQQLRLRRYLVEFDGPSSITENTNIADGTGCPSLVGTADSCRKILHSITLLFDPEEDQETITSDFKYNLNMAIESGDFEDEVYNINNFSGIRIFSHNAATSNHSSEMVNNTALISPNGGSSSDQNSNDLGMNTKVFAGAIMGSVFVFALLVLYIDKRIKERRRKQIEQSFSSGTPISSSGQKALLAESDDSDDNSSSNNILSINQERGGWYTFTLSPPSTSSNQSPDETDKTSGMTNKSPEYYNKFVALGALPNIYEDEFEDEDDEVVGEMETFEPVVQKNSRTFGSMLLSGGDVGRNATLDSIYTEDEETQRSNKNKKFMQFRISELTIDSQLVDHHDGGAAPADGGRAAAGTASTSNSSGGRDSVSTDTCTGEEEETSLWHLYAGGNKSSTTREKVELRLNELSNDDNEAYCTQPTSSIDVSEKARTISGGSSNHQSAYDSTGDNVAQNSELASTSACLALAATNHTSDKIQMSHSSIHSNSTAGDNVPYSELVASTSACLALAATNHTSDRIKESHSSIHSNSNQQVSAVLAGNDTTNHLVSDNQISYAGRNMPGSDVEPTHAEKRTTGGVLSTDEIRAVTSDNNIMSDDGGDGDVSSSRGIADAVSASVSYAANIASGLAIYRSPAAAAAAGISSNSIQQSEHDNQLAYADSCRSSSILSAGLTSVSTDIHDDDTDDDDDDDNINNHIHNIVEEDYSTKSREKVTLRLSLAAISGGDTATATTREEKQGHHHENEKKQFIEGGSIISGSSGGYSYSCSESSGSFCGDINAQYTIDETHGVHVVADTSSDDYMSWRRSSTTSGSSSTNKS